MIEVRRMRATDADLKSLLANLMASEYGDHNDPLRTFEIFDMTYTSEAPVTVLVRGQFSDWRMMSVTLTEKLIISSFILFCAKANIPMSRKSVKSIARVSGGVAFDMVVRNISIDATNVPVDQIKHAFSPAVTVPAMRQAL